MYPQKLTIVLVGLASCLFFQSCQKEVNRPKDLLTTETADEDLKLRLEQATMITGTVMTDTSIAFAYKRAVLDRVAKDSNDDEAISMKEIVADAAVCKSFSKVFKEKYLALFISRKYYNSEKYDVITNRILGKSNASRLNLGANRTDASALPPALNIDSAEVFMTSESVQIYFPYSDNFTTDTRAPYFTYYPLDSQNVLTGYKTFKTIVMPDGSSQTIPFGTFMANEDSAYNHAIYVLNFGDPAYVRVATSTPPPPAATCTNLTYNTLSDSVDDRYVISCSMPKIRLMQNIRSWVGGSNYLSLGQAYTIPVKLDVNPTDGSLAVKDTNRLIRPDFPIKRKYVRKGWWKDYGEIWSGDWRLIRYNNAMCFSGKAGWLKGTVVNVGYTINAGVQYDTAQRRFKPSFNAGINITGNLKFDAHYWSTGTDYITRRDMLSHVVGDAFGLGVATQAGETVPYTVRQCGYVRYYFKDYICY